jgi:hypothetical protein
MVSVGSEAFCISLLDAGCGFWGKRKSITAKAELALRSPKTARPQWDILMGTDGLTMGTRLPDKFKTQAYQGAAHFIAGKVAGEFHAT